MILPFIFAIILGSPTTAPITHEFHLSKCEIDYDKPSQSMQISLHLFLDDLELALRHLGADSLYLCTSKEDPKGEFYIAEYLRQKVKLSSAGKTFDFDFVGKEISEDLSAVWCYFEVKSFPIDRDIEIENSVLMELFEDQKNITSVKISDDIQKHFLFDKGETIGLIKIP